MKVSKRDILEIKAGKFKAFTLGSREACNSARVMCQYVMRSGEMPSNVERYTTQTDYQTNTIVIYAHKREVV